MGISSVLTTNYTLIDLPDTDFWKETPEEVKHAIRTAKEEMDCGEGIPHAQVMAEIKRRFFKRVIGKRKSLILALYINMFFFSACNSKEINSSQKNEKKDSLRYVQQNRSLQMNTSKTVFIDDEFLFKLIENELSIGYFKKNFREITSQIIDNKHNSALSDTVFVYSNGIDTVNFYVSQPNVILQEASINSQEITLDNDIKIGVSKDVFKNKFDLENLHDSLVIKDFENTSYFLFIFNNDLLIKINYKSRYLD